MEHLFVVISHSSRSLSENYAAFNATNGDIVVVRLYFALLFFWDCRTLAAKIIFYTKFFIAPGAKKPCSLHHTIVCHFGRRWRSTMPQFLCASLNSLAKLLRERYDARSNMVLRNFPDQDLLMAEYEIIR